MTSINDLWVVIVTLALLACAPHSQAAAQNKLFPDLKRAAIYRLQITYPDHTVTLFRKGTAWVLPNWNNYPANDVYVRMLLQTLLEADAGQTVSDGEALFPADRTVTVTAYDQQDAILAQLRIGLPGDTFREAHVQRVGESQFRRVRADFIPAVYRDSWGHRWVWRVPVKLLKAVHLQGFGVERHYHRDANGQWLNQESAPVVPPQAQSLDRLSSWRAGGVLYQPRAPSSWRPTARITIEAGPASMHLSLQQRADGIWLGRRDGMPVQFQFSQGFIKDLVSPLTRQSLP